MRNQIRVGRLNRTADLLKTVKPKRFNMNFWATGTEGKVHLSCGAAACALGWEASQPRARRAGLRLVFWEQRNYLVACCTDQDGKDLFEYKAAAHYYGITQYEAMHIFDPDTYNCKGADVKKSAVIKRLCSLAKHYKDNPV